MDNVVNTGQQPNDPNADTLYEAFGKANQRFSEHGQAIENKVEKVSGKGLSTEDYTTQEKNKLAGIAPGAQENAVTSVAGKTGAVSLVKSDVGLSNVDNTADASKPVSTAQQSALDNKVDKVSGKGLSESDYTSGEKTKLAGIAASADVTSAANVGAAIHGVASKATPADADTMPLIDSAASNALKKLSWANIKATLKTYFDTLYAAISHTHTKANITDFAHSHGNISNTGAIGSESFVPVITGNNGVLTTGSFGNTQYQYCRGDDARLSNARQCDNTFANKATAKTNLGITYGTANPSGGSDGDVYFQYE